jgi:hypothetical protein
MVAGLVEKYPSFYVTTRLISIFTRTDMKYEVLYSLIQHATERIFNPGLSTKPVAVALTHAKSIFLLHFNLAYLIKEPRNADLLFLSGPQRFLKIFSTHSGVFVLEFRQFLFEYYM